MKCNRALKLTLLIAIFTATVAIVPSAIAGDWEEGRFELYGPHVEQIRFNFYAGPTPEFVAVEGGDIDITDWWLDRSWVDKWSVPPYTGYIEQDWCGGERGIFCIDINQNESMPDGSYNPFGDRTAEITMTIESPGAPDEGETYTAYRGYHLIHAVCHLLKREDFITTVLQGLGEAVYAWMPSFYGANVNPAVDEHPYSPVEAAEILDKAGFVDTDADTLRNDPVTGANLNIDFVYRFQHTPGRKEIGEWLALELEAVDVDVTLDPKDGTGAFVKVMVEKNYHMYTGGWNLGTTPDHFFGLKNSDMYWDSGMFCLNYENHHDDLFDYTSELVYYAPDATTARIANWDCQDLYVDPARIGGPSFYASMAPKASSMYYVGTEYAGVPWTNMVNELGFGINTYLTFVNMRLEGVEEQAGTVEYGIYVSKIPGDLNPLYASWYTDYEVIGKSYDSLLNYNPYNPTDLSEYQPWLAYAWDVGTWSNPDNPDFPTSTKLTFYLAKNILWHDGTPFTSADVKYTIERALDLEDVDWYPSVVDVHHVETPDDYTVIVYENVLSCWALNWIGLGFPVVPKHIWEAIPDANVRDFCPDPQIIGTGPFKAYPHSIDPLVGDYYVPESYLLLDKNPAFFRHDPCTNILVRPDKLETYESYNINVYLHNEKVTSGATYNVRVHVVEDAYDSGWVAVPLAAHVPPGGHTAPCWTMVDFNVPWALNYAGITRTIIVTVQGQPAQTFVGTNIVIKRNGDVDGDADVDVIDALTMRKHYLCEPPVDCSPVIGLPNTAECIQCDTNCDGKVSLLDFLVLRSVYPWP